MTFIYGSHYTPWPNCALQGTLTRRIASGTSSGRP